LIILAHIWHLLASSFALNPLTSMRVITNLNYSNLLIAIRIRIRLIEPQLSMILSALK
jgi:hypothetical protein